MPRTLTLRAITALAALTLLAGPALAQSKKAPAKGKTAAEAPAQDREAPTTKKPIALLPEGMKWGMVRGDLEKLVDKFIDEDFKPKYKAAGYSASKLKDLDAEVATQKAAFRRSYIELTPGPTGLDSNPIATEYTKGNNEAIMSHQRGPGVKIWFFFIGGRLWKTVEDVSLIEGGLYGKDVSEATKKILSSVGGTLPRIVPANPDKGSFYDVFDWQDASTHMRLWDRGGVLMIAREDRVTLANLPSLRKNTSSSNDKGDSSISGVLRDDDAPKDPPKDDKSKKKLATAQCARSASGQAACSRSCCSPQAVTTSESALHLTLGRRQSHSHRASLGPQTAALRQRVRRSLSPSRRRRCAVQKACSPSPTTRALVATASIAGRRR